MTLDMATIVGQRDIVLVTLDALRYDVAERARRDGMTPHFAELLGGAAWEERHAPGSFTLSSHQAIFAGFLPTPARPGRHRRLFAVNFAGSATTGPGTWTCDEPDIVSGLAAAGYHTVCIGGTGFFDGASPLGRVLPALFAEHHWRPSFGVASRRSAELQFAQAARVVADTPAERRLLLFINVSAPHPPTRAYLQGCRRDSVDSQAAALADVDRWLPTLTDALTRRGPWFGIFCADHGTAFGEDGWHGHRLAHPAVWTVPYAEVLS